MRDLKKYTSDYINMPFEDEQLKFRRNKVIEIISNYKPKNILEIGSGMDSIVNHYNDFSSFTIVEPSKKFYEKAIQDNSAKNNDYIFNDYLEKYCIKNSVKKFDFIIVSSLLHELENKVEFISKLKEISAKKTVIHFNVPNARSFHRLLALEMSVIDDLFSKSEMQKKMQQDTIFDIESLITFLKSQKFKILDQGSYFIKPFTHLQMQSIINNEIFPPNLLDGLSKMINHMPNMGSEIYANVELS